MNLQDVEKHNAALREKFGADEVFAMAGVSQTQFSIARHYGGVGFNGHHYIYNPMEDSLIREDVVKWIAKKDREEKAKRWRFKDEPVIFDTDKLEEIEYQPGRFLLAHKADRCEGPCPLHGPSDHHMVDWPLHWRGDRGIFERTCKCGVGHPDPDTIAYLEKKHGKKVAATASVHGCCGCCRKPTN